jgi:SAM-dependent methyltransferase
MRRSDLSGRLTRRDMDPESPPAEPATHYAATKRRPFRFHRDGLKSKVNIRFVPEEFIESPPGTTDGATDMTAPPNSPSTRSSAALIRRSCPLCGTESGPGDIKVRAPIRAESLIEAERAEYWRGFRSRSCFFDFAQCPKCRLLYCPTYFSQSALNGLYSSMQDNTAGAAPDVLSDTHAGYIQFLAAQRPLEGTYLEVGPDIGLATAAAHASGKIDRSVLIEPNQAVHEELRHASGVGPTEIVSSMEDLETPAHADNAVLIHVLDHLIAPLAYLRQLHDHLNPGAMVLIVVHNQESFLRRALGVRWPPFCLQHPQLFSPNTLSNSLRVAGFSIVSSKPTTNVFPLRHVIKTGASLLGIPGSWAERAPNNKIRLRLGNMMVVAKA